MLSTKVEQLVSANLEIHRINPFTGIVYPAIDRVVQPYMIVEHVNKSVPILFIDVLANIFKVLPSVSVWRDLDRFRVDLNMEPLVPREKYSIVRPFEFRTVFSKQQAGVSESPFKVW